MSCSPKNTSRVTVNESAVTVVAGDAIDLGSGAVTVSVVSSPITTIEVGVPGPQGPPGEDGVGSTAGAWPQRPDATLSYVSGVLTRVDYSDGSFKDLTYSSGLLTLVSGQDSDGDTRTVNLSYSGGLLTTVTRT